MEFHIKDPGLADEGALKVEWANQSMPVLNSIRRRFEREKPLKGVVLGTCLHVTTETASLVETLKAGGRTCTCAPQTP